MSYYKAIIDLPEHERLETALDVIRMLEGTGDQVVAWSRKLGIPRSRAILFTRLWNARGVLVTNDSLQAAFEQYGLSDTDTMVKVCMSHLRARLRDITGIADPIKNVWGTGYELTPETRTSINRFADDPIDLEEVEVPEETTGNIDMVGRRWTREEDLKLLKSLLRGDPEWTVARDLGRTPRACRDRLTVIKKRNAV